MGLFFDREPTPDVIDVLARAYRKSPPAPADMDSETGHYLRQIGGPLVDSVVTALANDELQVQEAQTRARSAGVSRTTLPVSTKFHSGRFIVALLIFVALVVGGAVTDALNLAASSGAFFGLAGSILGTVIGFIGSEKGP
jgi:hypothetical protein